MVGRGEAGGLIRVDRPFTSKIYSSAEAKKRSGAPASSSESTKKTDTKRDTSSAQSTATATSQQSSTGSYARAAARPAAVGQGGLESTDPKPVPQLADLGLGAPVASAGAPRAVRTRSRAGRVVDDD